MVLKVVTGKILRTLGLSSGPMRLVLFWELASCLSAIQNFFRPAGAYRHSAFYPRLAPWASFLRRFAAIQVVKDRWLSSR